MMNSGKLAVYKFSYIVLKNASNVVK